MAKCTKGHEYQCHAAIRDRCECACHGENHGRFDQWWKDNVDRDLLAKAATNPTEAQEKGDTSHVNARRPT